MLREAALQVQKNAYAPYSKFQVGVAIKSGNGNVFCGVNERMWPTLKELVQKLVLLLL